MSRQKVFSNFAFSKLVLPWQEIKIKHDPISPEEVLTSFWFCSWHILIVKVQLFLLPHDRVSVRPFQSVEIHVLFLLWIHPVSNPNTGQYSALDHVQSCFFSTSSNIGIHRVSPFYLPWENLSLKHTPQKETVKFWGISAVCIRTQQERWRKGSWIPLRHAYWQHKRQWTRTETWNFVWAQDVSVVKEAAQQAVEPSSVEVLKNQLDRSLGNLLQLIALSRRVNYVTSREYSNLDNSVKFNFQLCELLQMLSLNNGRPSSFPFHKPQAKHDTQGLTEPSVTRQISIFQL